MENSHSNNRDQNPPREVRVENLGRFGNYFFVKGFSTGFGDQIPRIEYSFEGMKGPVVAEFSFSPLSAATSEPCDPRHFLELFWINDGYRFKIDNGSPVNVSFIDRDSGTRIGGTMLHEIRENDFALFLEALEILKYESVWTNRVVLEIVNSRNPADKARFLRKTVDSAGWQVMDSAFQKIHAGVRERDSAPLLLDVCSHWFSGMDGLLLPPDIKKQYVAWVGLLDVSRIDRELLFRVVFQLTRFDLNLACRTAHAAITTLEFDSEELAALLRHCFPRHSQWWILHTLKNTGLGPEQVSDSLNVAGTGAASQGQTDLAVLSYEAALHFDPKAQSAAWNLGWLHADRGDIKLAEKAFGRISRHYPNQSLSTCWPQINGLAWPAAPMTAAHFPLPPEASNWPRITVITPSFNQGSYIGETILSVLNQDYPNLQYIVVDGASTDETGEVLKRYQDRIDHLIVEPDHGQTEAINKGLRLADGEIIAWLNSDDMYAPGTLHTVALKWMDSQADVIAGICLEHENHRFRLINKPAARNIDFNAPQLARIFKYWFKGYYFYQPEAFFSKKILDAVGLPDESLYYAMDYDLWMRFADAGAFLDVVDWPFAFFRKHDTQKTANLMDCLEEQAAIRSRHHELNPSGERLHQIRRGLAALKRKNPVQVGILSLQPGKTLSKTLQDELDGFPIDGFDCYLLASELDPRVAETDVVILLVHLQNELKTIASLRSINPDIVICGWLWNSQQDPFGNHSSAEVVDVVFHGHAGYGNYLRNDQAVHGGPLTTCITRWARQDVVGWFGKLENARRNSELHGTFVEDGGDPGRTATFLRLLEKLPGNKVSITTEVDVKKSRSTLMEKELFEDSCRYQTSVILPFRNDLSQRVQEALLAGQIPLVPEQVNDLDLLISKEQQSSLPIIRFSSGDPAGFEAAYILARGIYLKEGITGARKRHEYALANGMFSSRIKELLALLESKCCLD